jgi:hypothetical protein
MVLISIRIIPDERLRGLTEIIVPLLVQRAPVTFLRCLVCSLRVLPLCAAVMVAIRLYMSQIVRGTLIHV